MFCAIVFVAVNFKVITINSDFLTKFNQTEKSQPNIVDTTDPYKQKILNLVKNNSPFFLRRSNSEKIVITDGVIFNIKFELNNKSNSTSLLADIKRFDNTVCVNEEVKLTNDSFGFYCVYKNSVKNNWIPITFSKEENDSLLKFYEGNILYNIIFKDVNSIEDMLNSKYKQEILKDKISFEENILLQIEFENELLKVMNNHLKKGTKLPIDENFTTEEYSISFPEEGFVLKSKQGLISFINLNGINDEKNSPQYIEFKEKEVIKLWNKLLSLHHLEGLKSAVETLKDKNISQH